MALPGWYPDPDGTPGRLRYFDGTRWSAETSDDPAAGRTPGTGAAENNPAPRRRRGRTGPLVVLAALLVVIIVVVAAVLLHGRSSSGADPGSPSSTISSYDDSKTGAPSPSPSGSSSPVPSTGTPSTGRPVACDRAGSSRGAAPAADGRVHGGPLSFTQLPEPWFAPQPTGRVPYSRDSQVQVLPLPERLSWQASAQVGVTTFQPYPGGEEATSEMLQCVLTSDFYTGVDVHVTKNEVRAGSISGRRATVRTVELAFHHPELKTRGSLLVFEVVESDPVSYWFSAVPVERTDLISQLDAARSTLRVG